MITMQSAPGKTLKGQSGLTYKADKDGIIHYVRTGDVETLRAAGAEPIILPATKHLRLKPGQMIHFAGKTHQADEHGVLKDVPHDHAMVLIRNGSATEHVENAPHVEVNPPAPEEPEEPDAEDE